MDIPIRDRRGNRFNPSVAEVILLKITGYFYLLFKVVIEDLYCKNVKTKM